jgi:hypothetical protein
MGVKINREHARVINIALPEERSTSAAPVRGDDYGTLVGLTCSLVTNREKRLPFHKLVYAHPQRNEPSKNEDLMQKAECTNSGEYQNSLCSVRLPCMSELSRTETRPKQPSLCSSKSACAMRN